MQSNLWAPGWLPAPHPYQHHQPYYTYGTHPSFSSGFAPLLGDYAQGQPTYPSSRSDATGSHLSQSFPCAFSATALPSGAPYSPVSSTAHTATTSPLKSVTLSDPAMAVSFPPMLPTLLPGTPAAPDTIEPADPDAGSEPSPSPLRQDDAPEQPRTANRKNHPCWMCHKSFDRPSTLRKHLLVHTGHKAYACDICGRRFGVLSNLNRHAKKCAQKSGSQGALACASPDGGVLPDDSDSADGGVLPDDGVLACAAPDAGPSAASSTASAPARGRKRKGSPPADGGGVEQEAAAAKGRRARRKQSPTRWVPDSLRQFELSPSVQATPVPLPPVRPLVDTNGKVLEERDSYSADCHATPYHPRGWRGRLPGPGLVGVDGAAAGIGRLYISEDRRAARRCGPLC